MRVALRADAGIREGTGHVMRVLTLAVALRDRGHEPRLFTAPIDVAWLSEHVSRLGIAVQSVERGSLAGDAFSRFDPDRVVIDSYAIAPADIGRLHAEVPVLAIVDGDSRGIQASLYLDHNLGAETRKPAADPARMLRGSAYALIRDEVVRAKRPRPWVMSPVPSVVSFMGGTDPTGASARVAAALASLDRVAQITVIAPEASHHELRQSLGEDGGVVSPTPDLPALLGNADVVVTAAGVSAWEVCTLAVPSVVIAIAENQQASLVEATTRGVALGIDAIVDPDRIEQELAGMVRRLLDDQELRHRLSSTSAAAFDGRGAERVAEAVEKMENRP